MYLSSRKQRRKVVTAGRYIRAIQYSLNCEPDVRRTRLPKTQISSVAQEAMNLKHSWQKLKALIASNFSNSDLVVTLTYSDKALPRTKRDAEKHLKAFIRKFRTARRSVGSELPYLYVTEMGHSSGRLHHHMITTSTGNDLETIRSLWKHGDEIDISYIGVKGYDGWARYLSKEPRELGRHYVGERMWRASKGLLKPNVYYGWVNDPLTINDLPPGSFVIDRQSRNNGYGEFTYIEAMLPSGTSEDGLSLISDLT